MLLTVFERCFLSAVYSFLANYDPESKATYDHRRRALDEGFELDYGFTDEHVLNAQQCKEVYDILTMHMDLRRATQHDAESRAAVRFRGFASSEKQKQYAQFLLDGGKFVELGPTVPVHPLTMIESYQSMLKEWNASENRHALTEDDVLRIIRSE